MKRKILIIDDEVSVLKVMKIVLENMQYEVTECFRPEEAIFKLENEQYDLMVSDLRLNHRVDGLFLLKEAKLRYPKMPVILISAYATVKIAVEAIRNGAHDLVTKPFKIDDFATAITSALDSVDNLDLEAVPAENTNKLYFNNFIGDSKQMSERYAAIKKLADNSDSVLIMGEGGTGRSTTAQVICSERTPKGEVFILNGAKLTLPELMSELERIQYHTESDTVLFENVDSFDKEMQQAIWEFLKVANLKMMATASLAITKKKSDKRFLPELYTYLSDETIVTHPLRELPSDLNLVVNYILKQHSDKDHLQYRLSGSARKAILSYSWPENYPELKESLEQAIRQAPQPMISGEDLPNFISMKYPGDGAEVSMGNEKPLKDYLRQQEKEYIKLILRRANGNRVKTASILGISRASLYRKLED